MTTAEARFAHAVAAFEADAGRLAEMQADAVLTRFSDYVTARVPRASLVESGLRNVSQLCAILRSGQPPGAGELDEARRARERTAQGVPADTLYDAYRLVLRLLGDAFLGHAEHHGVPRERLLAALRLLWASADALTSAVVVARLAAELDVARHDEGRRLDLLRALVFGSRPLVELRQRMAGFGLGPDRSYYVLRARAATPLARETLRGRLESSLRTYGCRPLCGIVDGDVTVLAPLRPPRGESGYTAGVAGPCPVEGLAQAYVMASRLLEVARGFGLEGPHELGDLSLKVAVSAEADLGQLLDIRHLAPLREAGEFGRQLIDTLKTHLANGARIADTAAALGVHPNTIRHRLARAAELSGADFERLEVLFELWWALNWAQHGGAG